jgi:hypothetical protein
MAGVGETATAVRWRHRFPDGQFYLDLRSTTPASLTLAGLVVLHCVRRVTPDAMRAIAAGDSRRRRVGARATGDHGYPGATVARHLRVSFCRRRARPERAVDTKLAAGTISRRSWVFSRPVSVSAR